MGGGGDSDHHHRSSLTSFRSSSAGVPHGQSSSLRNVEHAPQIPEHRELDFQFDFPPSSGPVEMPADDRVPTLPQISEVSTTTNTNNQTSSGSGNGDDMGSSPTLPTNAYELPDEQNRRRISLLSSSSSPQPPPPMESSADQGQGQGYQEQQRPASSQPQQQLPPQIRLPGVDGRESLSEDWLKDTYASMNLAGTLSGK